MYKCAICGMVFDEPAKVRYPLCRIDGQQFYDHDHVCPFCGSDGIDYVEQCDECGEYYFDDDLVEDGDRLLCRDCSDNHRNPYHGCNTAMDAVFKMLEVI